MYTSFFGLNEKPFSITPDPRYLFMSERHGEALAHLVYGVTESGGFVQLTGEVGTGKTTLVRTLLLNRLPENADVAVVLNPQLTALEFLQTITEELHLPEPDERNSGKALTDALNQHLLDAHADGRRTILVVDEAQNLAPEVLEQVRLLTNLETAKQKLLQIILIGQPELRELLARNDLRQLAQRITGRYHLEPLSRDETAEYIEHRLRVAGAVGEVFEVGAKRTVFRLSQGVPRLINVICDRALLGAYGSEQRRVGRRLVRRAAAEISGQMEPVTWPRWTIPAIATAAVAMVAISMWIAFANRAEPVAETTALEVFDVPASQEQPPAELRKTEPLPVTETESEIRETLDEQLALATDLTNFETAFAALYTLWDIDANDVVPTCGGAESAGFSCHSQRGNFNSLRQLDRPAILALTDSRGASHRVVLTALHGEMAELLVAGVRVSHPIKEISDMWFGQYTMLWRPPNGVSVSLGPGLQDPNVSWLRRSLATIDERYRADPFESEVFDALLEQRVREFQRDHRLAVDGWAGKQTQIIINSLLTIENTPRLLTSRLAQD